MYIPEKSNSIMLGIVTRLQAGDSGILVRFQAEENDLFSDQSVQTGSEAHPASYIMGTRSFPAVKRPGRGVNHPPHLAPRLIKRIQLYIYSLSGLSWSVLG
jgi:hypothetical protein